MNNTFKCGQRFLLSTKYVTGKEHILASTLLEPSTFLCLLIDLQTGNSWTHPIIVQDPYAVTETEFKQLLSHAKYSII